MNNSHVAFQARVVLALCGLVEQGASFTERELTRAYAVYLGQRVL